MKGKDKSIKTKLVSRFRTIALLEGISYLLLLGVAMPLKYIYALPEAVKYVGWIHGLLFIAYGLQLLQIWMLLNWAFADVLWAFVAALLPFGTFVLDRKLRKIQREALHP